MKSKKNILKKSVIILLVFILAFLGLYFSDEWYSYNVYNTLRYRNIKYMDMICNSNTIIAWEDNGNYYEQSYGNVRSNLINVLNDDKFHYDSCIERINSLTDTKSVFVFTIIGRYLDDDVFNNGEVAMQIFPSINIFTAKKIQSDDKLFGYMFFDKSITEDRFGHTGSPTGDG